MATSYNGWPVLPSAAGRLDNSVIPGTDGIKFAPGLLAGDVADVLFFVGCWIHVRVERLINPGCWGYSYRANRNAANWSCHASATAADVSAPKHPNGVRGTWVGLSLIPGRSKIEEIRSLLAFLEGGVQWGEDYTGTVDGMHFEIIKDAAFTARIAQKIRNTYGPRENWPAVLAAGALAPTPVPTPAPAPSPISTPSGYSEQAKTDQFNLNDTGFDCGTPDGYWGEKSKAACAAFQRAAGIAADGICGAATRAMLAKVPSWRTGGLAGGYSALRWQQELKNHGWRIETDGIWGAHSKSILTQFQAEKHLVADGIPGPSSWTALFCQPN